MIEEASGATAPAFQTADQGTAGIGGGLSRSMPTSVDLFSYPNGAGFKERGQTSQAAARSIESNGRAKSLEQRVLDLFQDGWTGTADECAAALGEHPLSIRPRLSQLRALGKITETGKTIPGDFGKPVHVWRAVP